MQAPLDNNFFDLFGLDKVYALDRRLLRDRFRDLQKQFHPDNFVNAPEQDRRISAQYAASINEAFTTLNDPVSRARYMLSLAGILLDDNDTQMDPEFLMQQIELRENLEQAKASTLEELKNLSERVDTDFSSRTLELENILDKSDQKPNDVARQLVREMQFLNRMQHEILEAEESFY